MSLPIGGSYCSVVADLDMGQEMQGPRQDRSEEETRAGSDTRIRNLDLRQKPLGSNGGDRNLSGFFLSSFFPQ